MASDDSIHPANHHNVSIGINVWTQTDLKIGPRLKKKLRKNKVSL